MRVSLYPPVINMIKEQDPSITDAAKDFVVDANRSSRYMAAVEAVTKMVMAEIRENMGGESKPVRRSFTDRVFRHL